MNDEASRPTTAGSFTTHLLRISAVLRRHLVATLYHYLLGREAPYPWYDLPVVLGTVGGIGLMIGPAGLLLAKGRRDPAVQDEARPAWMSPSLSCCC